MVKRAIPVLSNAAEMNDRRSLVTRLVEEVEAEYPQAADAAKWRLVQAQFIIAMVQAENNG